jgi:hypothetical protein
MKIKIGQLTSGIERNGRRRELRGAKLSAIKESSAPGRRRRICCIKIFKPGNDANH